MNFLCRLIFCVFDTCNVNISVKLLYVYNIIMVIVLAFFIRLKVLTDFFC